MTSPNKSRVNSLIFTRNTDKNGPLHIQSHEIHACGIALVLNFIYEGASLGATRGHHLHKHSHPFDFSLVGKLIVEQLDAHARLSKSPQRELDYVQRPRETA